MVGKIKKEILNLIENIIPESIELKYGDCTNEDYAYADGWNDCRDEVIRRKEKIKKEIENILEKWNKRGLK